MSTLKKFWMIAENNHDSTYYYCGYYEKCKPVFNLAIAEALQIATFESAKNIYDIFNEIFPCEMVS
ncbi:hypothetical protein SAMN04488511_11983 [Pedobacter suwonensis]|uniref:Uncharacterized protein n=1 Tax=Pedobacter suwonensis TaxID=332999 RepID=A0A1I0U3T7_9SPHI|nr:hypothetical protein [Pedobacter suwonensis]SFA58517.1 hypothetical protein SAMN04488511_11983 [Pedobacter suwonensis]